MKNNTQVKLSGKFFQGHCQELDVCEVKKATKIEEKMADETAKFLSSIPATHSSLHINSSVGNMNVIRLLQVVTSLES